MQKVYFFIIITLFPLFLLGTCSLLNPFSTQAQEWVQTFIYRDNKIAISKQDLDYLTQFCKDAALRSESTIESNQAALDAWQILWHGYENIAKTRRNPSLATPHAMDLEQEKTQLLHFAHCQHKHRETGKQYAQTAELVIKGNVLSTQAQEAVQALKNAAREVTVKAFLSSKERLGDVYDLAKHYINRSPTENIIEQLIAKAADYCSESFHDTQRTIMDNLISAITGPLLMKTFINWEHTNLEACHQVWKTLMTLLEIETSVWQALEEARAAYYWAHFDILCQLANNTFN